MWIVLLPGLQVTQPLLRYQFNAFEILVQLEHPFNNLKLTYFYIIYQYSMHILTANISLTSIDNALTRSTKHCARTFHVSGVRHLLLP